MKYDFGRRWALTPGNACPSPAETELEQTRITAVRQNRLVNMQLRRYSTSAKGQHRGEPLSGESSTCPASAPSCVNGRNLSECHCSLAVPDFATLALQETLLWNTGTADARLRCCTPSPLARCRGETPDLRRRCRSYRSFRTGGVGPSLRAPPWLLATPRATSGDKTRHPSLISYCNIPYAPLPSESIGSPRR